MVLENWLRNESRFQITQGVSKLLTKRNADGYIVMILSEVTDDIMFSGLVREMIYLVHRIWTRFIMRKSILDRAIKFNGCTINQDSEENNAMEMIEYHEGIKRIEI